MPQTEPPRLDIVGIGMTLATQLSPEARDRIRDADIVFAQLGGPLMEVWLKRLNPNLISLQNCYAAGDRRKAYKAMVEMVMGALRCGKKVCAVFYGHPGVFVTPGHEMVKRARAEAYRVRMFPAISAEDCLYADLGVDPGLGCQSYEARDFFLNARRIDTGAALILWQIAVMADQGFSRFDSEPRALALLAEALQEHYPKHHEVVVYEAATLVMLGAHIERLALADLPHARVTQASTLYVPARTQAAANPLRVAALEALATQSAVSAD